MRLNLGCGPGPIRDSSFIYIDASRKLLIAKVPILNFLYQKISNEKNLWDKKIKFKNILKLKLSNNSVEIIYSSHLLEHLYFNEAEDLTKKLFKSLKPNGVCRFALPDYDLYIQEFIEIQKTNPLLAIQTFEKSLLSNFSHKIKPTKKVWGWITGNLHLHKWHPNYALVENILREAGFSQIKRCNFRESSISNISNLEFRSDMTFYIEAVKYPGIVN
jgi:predicted SAM-dependent methyltransferase